MITIGITYEIVTPESDEYGDAEDRGWHADRKEWEPTDLREAIYVLLGRGHVEPSDSSVRIGSWFTAYDDGERCRWNFETGGRENLSLHVEGVTLSTMRRIARALGVKV